MQELLALLLELETLKINRDAVLDKYHKQFFKAQTSVASDSVISFAIKDLKSRIGALAYDNYLREKGILHEDKAGDLKET